MMAERDGGKPRLDDINASTSYSFSKNSQAEHEM